MYTGTEIQTALGFVFWSVFAIPMVWIAPLAIFRYMILYHDRHKNDSYGN